MANDDAEVDDGYLIFFCKHKILLSKEHWK